MKYLVIREHWGDKQYKVGDVREAIAADVAPLIGRCLEVAKSKKPAAKTKAAKKLKNKSAV